MLNDAIILEQTTFLALWFILDKIVLTQETLHLDNTSTQPSIFLKLDFLKVYDKESWHILLYSMKKIGISETFISKVNFFFGIVSNNKPQWEFGGGFSKFTEDMDIP